MGGIIKIIKIKKSQLKKFLHDPLYKNSFYLMMKTITGAGGGFIFWLFAARFYSENSVGLGSAIIAGMNLLVILSILGFDIGIIAYLPSEKEKNRMINSSLTIVCVSSIISAIIFIFGIDIWSPALSILKDSNYMVLFVLFTISYTLVIVQGNVFVASRNAKYSFVQSLIAISRIALLPLLIAFSIFGLFFSYGLGMILAFVAGNILISKVYTEYRFRPLIDTKLVKNMFHFTFGNYIAMIFESLPRVILPLMVINLLGAKMNAYFYIAWSFSGLLLMIPRATSLSLYAEGLHTPEQLKKDTVRSLKFVFIFLIPIIIGIILFGDFFLSIFGEGYSINAFDMFVVLAIACVPFSINEIFIATRRARKKVLPVIYIYSFVALFTMIASYILTIRIGLIGVGVSWLLGNSIVAVILFGLFIKNR